MCYEVAKPLLWSSQVVGSFVHSKGEIFYFSTMKIGSNLKAFGIYNKYGQNRNIKNDYILALLKFKCNKKKTNWHRN